MLVKHFLCVCAAFVAAVAMAAAPVKASSVNAVGCYGAGCRGKDPQAMGCNADAVTLASASAPGQYRVDLRYSRRCNARWARTTFSGWLGYEAVGFAYLGSGSATKHDDFGQVVWSRMWTGPIRACGGFSTIGDYVSQRCTVAR